MLYKAVLTFVSGDKILNAIIQIREKLLRGKCSLKIVLVFSAKNCTFVR